MIYGVVKTWRDAILHTRARGEWQHEVSASRLGRGAPWWEDCARKTTKLDSRSQLRPKLKACAVHNTSRPIYYRCSLVNPPLGLPAFLASPRPTDSLTSPASLQQVSRISLTYIYIYIYI